MTPKRESKKSMALFNLLIKVVYASLFIETSADPCGRVDSQQRRKAHQVPSVGCNGEQPGHNGNCATGTGPGRIVNWTRITGTSRGRNGNQSEREPRTRKGIISPIPMKLGDPPALANFIVSGYFQDSRRLASAWSRAAAFWHHSQEEVNINRGGV